MTTCNCDYAAAAQRRREAARNATTEDEWLGVAETTVEDYLEPCDHCRELWELDTP